MAYVITDSCIKDSLCVEVCPTHCIHPKQDEPGFEAATQMYVDPEGCIDCGAGSTPQLKGDGFTVNQPPPTPSNCIEPRFDLFLALTFFSFPRYRRANECRQSDPQF